MKKFIAIGILTVVSALFLLTSLAQAAEWDHTIIGGLNGSDGVPLKVDADGKVYVNASNMTSNINTTGDITAGNATFSGNVTANQFIASGTDERVTFTNGYIDGNDVANTLITNASFRIGNATTKANATYSHDGANANIVVGSGNLNVSVPQNGSFNLWNGTTNFFNVSDNTVNESTTINTGGRSVSLFQNDTIDNADSSPVFQIWRNAPEYSPSRVLIYINEAGVPYIQSYGQDGLRFASNSTTHGFSFQQRNVTFGNSAINSTFYPLTTFTGWNYAADAARWIRLSPKPVTGEFEWSRQDANITAMNITFPFVLANISDVPASAVDGMFVNNNTGLWYYNGSAWNQVVKK